MRRWWLWIGGTIAVLVFALLALAFFLPRGGPYRFLNHHRPISLPVDAAQRKMMAQMGMDIALYSFQADFEALKKEADAELLPSGYTESGIGEAPTDTSRTATYMKADMAALASTYASPRSPTAPPKMPETRMVQIMKDTRLTSKTSMTAGPAQGKDKGWVTVIVMGTGERSIFDQFRDWVGL